ncbi:hypothetical protein ENUP19_0332G0020 [Entamoeba nuttalli]|uniref:Uncharacterized protein n=1 Tax=Entamoeba nuttalli TaxID=412467 RepID=A0ABQ0DWT6_9EUKA
MTILKKNGIKRSKSTPAFIPLESINIPNVEENEEPTLQDDGEDLEWHDNHMQEEIKQDPVAEDAGYW